MSRLNPLYIFILLIMFLVLGVFKLNNAKDELREEKVSYAETKLLSSDLSGLKKLYGDKVKIKKAIQSLLRHQNLKSANLTSEFKKSSVYISSKSINLISLNLLMRKILNGSYNISILNIKKLDNQKATLKLEIKW